jgi:Spy/CpxP family protein refolding chaperone
MNKQFRQYLIPAAVATGLGLSMAAFAQSTPAPVDGSHPVKEAREHDGQRHGGGHHRGHHGDRFMHTVRGLDLTEQQKTTLKGFFESGNEQRKAEFDGYRDQRRAFDTATPGSSGYANATAQLAEVEANQARKRVQDQAAMRTKVYAVLTPEQKTKLAAELAKTPEKPLMKDQK